MPAETIESPKMTAESHKSTFFRQSGWMMIATVVGGMFMAFIHVLSKFLPKDGVEYAAFGTLLQVVNWMGIPAIGLQMVIAQQTSAAITDKQRHQLVGTIHAVMLWTAGVWLVMAAITVACRARIIDALHLSNPMALWLTMAVGFVMLWFPIFQGLMQGRQNFLWLGWAGIFNGVGRVFIGGFIVIVLGGWAAGLVAGVLIGLSFAVGIGIWQNLDLLRESGAPFDAKGWLKRVIPLTFGLGASQFLFSADAIVVQNYLGVDGGAAPYIFGGTLARAIVLFTGPLAVVMFPKLVHSAARSQKTDLMAVTLIGTFVFGCLAVVGLMVTGPLLINRAFPAFTPILPVLPLFAWTMVPLGSANVLLFNLMAHSRFKIVPALVVLSVAYWVALQHFHDSFKMVIQTFGVFCLIYLGICAAFTWIVDKDKAAAETGDPVL